MIVRLRKCGGVCACVRACLKRETGDHYLIFLRCDTKHDFMEGILGY